MSNLYAPPRAPLEDPPDSSSYKSPEFRRRMNAIRPLGVVLVVAFFFVFSVASAVLLMLEGDQWWVAHVATTGLLTYLFRNLWWGEDKERKIAVFVGFFVVAHYLRQSRGGHCKVVQD